MVWSGK